MVQFWLTVIMPVVAGTGCITGIGLLRRYVLKTRIFSPLSFLRAYYGFATLIFGFLYLAIWGFAYPPVLTGFWTVVCLGAVANIVIQFFNAQAASLDIGEVSLTAPLQAMTPGLITFLAITLGEFPGPMGIIGVLLMMVGSYVLLWEKTPEHWIDYFGPLRRLRLLFRLRHLSSEERDKTIVVSLALGSAFFGTIGLLFDGLYVRRGVNVQGLILGGMTFTGFLAIIYGLLSIFKPDRMVNQDSGFPVWSKRTMLAIIGCSLFWVGHILLIAPAYCHTFVAYVGTLKRFSILFSVIMGWWLFRESDIRKRLWAALLIIAGAICISFDGIPAQLSSKLESLGF